MPDVFSIRHTTVEAYCEPIVHEVKVSRADLLGDVRREDKRRAYLDLGGECWYVLGRDPKGRAIGDADDVPPECGVLLLSDTGAIRSFGAAAVLGELTSILAAIVTVPCLLLVLGRLGRRPGQPTPHKDIGILP